MSQVTVIDHTCENKVAIEILKSELIDGRWNLHASFYFPLAKV